MFIKCCSFMKQENYVLLWIKFACAMSNIIHIECDAFSQHKMQKKEEKKCILNFFFFYCRFPWFLVDFHLIFRFLSLVLRFTYETCYLVPHYYFAGWHYNNRLVHLIIIIKKKRSAHMYERAKKACNPLGWIIFVALSVVNFL